ncbi:hypothetical protein XELAEV_18013455mg [Xenopus laevis]|uniref:Uncharacterized protein n=1 Tax=Xenopus laevis TaxID=8355 RepID=A0A974DPP3_XENLA|nr:hypothetical protein XELAEV_18013455mg [Xenopus laevis]
MNKDNVPLFLVFIVISIRWPLLHQMLSKGPLKFWRNGVSALLEVTKGCLAKVPGTGRRGGCMEAGISG